MRHEYIERLYEEKNIKGLKDELSNIRKIILNYEEELIELLDKGKHNGERIKKLAKTLDFELELKKKIIFFIKELSENKEDK